MKVLHHNDKEGNKRLVPTSPQRSKNPRFQVKRNKSMSTIPDLVGDKDVDTASDDSSSSREIIDIETKLQRAKERRDQSDRNREIDLNIRNARKERAHRRAKKSLLQKQAKIRHSTFKIAKANEERCLQEEKRRNDTMEMNQNKLSEAVSRAEQNLKRRQIKAKHSARLEKVQRKRALLDFERKSAILAIEDHREKATNNRLFKIKNRQYKAREEIEHAQLVAKRMKAVRTLQRITREKFRMGSGPTHGPLLSENDAAIRLQNWTLWRERVVARRLSKSSSIASLISVLKNVGDDDTNGTPHSFETLTSEITKSANLEYSRQFSGVFQPLLKTSGFKKRNNLNFISDRVLLLSFLISAHPDEVLGDKRHSDKCSARLEASCNALLQSLHDLVAIANAEHSLQQSLIRKVSQNLITYGTLFDLWKNADLMELVSNMVTSIEQSWIVFLTSKEALSYRSEEGNIPAKEGTFFQHRLRYETSRREAGSHIRRVRASIIKVLGREEGAEVLKDAKKSAIRLIKTESLIDKTRVEVDDIIAKRDRAVSLKDQNEADGKRGKFHTPKSGLFSNIKAVHSILLTDDDDVDAVREFSVLDGNHDLDDVDAVEIFFNTLKGGTDTKNSTSSVELMVAKTMERAFVDNVSRAWLQKDSETVKQLVLELCAKLRKLIPNRVDLHSLIQDSQVQSCNKPTEMLCVVQKIASILCDSLEAPIRSHSTSEWIQRSNISQRSPVIPFGFDNIEMFVVASILFLMKKADLCAIDLMNFDMLKAAPIIRQYGYDYELKEFEKTFGDLSSMKSMRHLNATWAWLSRVNFDSTESAIGKIKGEGFVDNLLFTQDAIEIPEVLHLDKGKVDSIRKVARKSVLCSALILRACSQIGASPKPSSLSSEAIFYKEKVLTCLKEGTSFDSLLGEVSDAIVQFAEAVSGNDMVELQVNSLRNSVSSILRGNDPVLKLMDNRVRQLFRVATGYSQDKEKVPSSLRSGISQNLRSNSTKISKKQSFMVELNKEAEKLGFGFVREELLQATYDGYKVINHCLALHEKQIFTPMMSEMRGPD